MHKMSHYPLHQSLLNTATVTGDTTTATTAIITTYDVHALTSWPPKSLHPTSLPNVPDVIFRLILISFFATIAIWANHEASKGFSVTIVNDAGKYSLPGKRFWLFYESNDKATKILLNTSSFVENLLYPNEDKQQTKKQINSVTLRLSAIKFPAIVSVHQRQPYEYTVVLSPLLMEVSNNNDAFELAMLQGMARVWLWDGKGATPPAVMNGMVEFISTLAGFLDEEVWNPGGGDTMSPSENDEICWKDKDPKKVAGFLRYYDQRIRPGGGGGGGEVLRRLNDGMRHGWHDGMMDDALDIAGEHVCRSYDILTRHHHPSSSI